MDDEMDGKKISRRNFLKKAAKASIGVALGSAGIGLAAVSADYLRPTSAFLEEWKGVFPFLDDEGYLVLSGARLVRDDVDEKAPPGGLAGLVFLWNDTYWDEVSPAIIVRDGDGAYMAASIKCTHEKCAPRWDDGPRVWSCACHNGVFEAETGKVLEGPPPAPLPQFEVTFEEDVVRLFPSGGADGAE